MGTLAGPPECHLSIKERGEDLAKSLPTGVEVLVGTRVFVLLQCMKVCGQKCEPWLISDPVEVAAETRSMSYHR